MTGARGVVLALAVLTACTSEHERAWFHELESGTGLDFRHNAFAEQRFHFPEIMGSGLGLLDFDQDGWLDVFVVQSGDLMRPDAETSGDRLYRNLGGLRFEDVTAASGIRDADYGTGCACADFDADGDTDVFVTNVGRTRLWRNEGGGRFSDATALANAGDDGWSTSAAWLDLENDGDLDLFVAHYVRWSPELESECFSGDARRDYCPPTKYASEPDVLLSNRGDGTFEDWSARAGLHAADGSGLGVGCGDWNADGFADVYVANDMQANQLWINDGSGHFRDEAAQRGCALSGAGFPEAGMGCAPFDVDQDGDLDVFATHLRGQKNTLYRNLRAPDGSRAGQFEDASARLGLAGPSLPFTGFGVAFADFDLDAHVDLFVANGRVGLEQPIEDPTRPYAERDLLFRWAGERFVVTARTGQARPAASRGLALGDLDNDGDLELVISTANGALRLLRNDAPRDRGWVMFDVREARGELARGARVTIESGGRRQHRSVDPAYSYLSSNDPRVHFGLGSARAIDAVHVTWLDGATSSFGARAPGAVHSLRRQR
jgi:hypothetical protein